MEPFETLGIPSPDECLGMVGLLVGLAGVVAGLVWLLAYDGATPSFVLVVLSLLVGWVSVLYCTTWEGSSPVGP